MKRLSQQNIDAIVKRFFKYGYSIKDNEYVGIVEYRNSLGAAYNNIIGIIPNDDVMGQPLSLVVYSLCADCSLKDAFDVYTDWVVSNAPELMCLEDREALNKLNDVWTFGWKNLDFYKK